MFHKWLYRVQVSTSIHQGTVTDQPFKNNLMERNNEDNLLCVWWRLPVLCPWDMCVALFPSNGFLVYKLGVGQRYNRLFINWLICLLICSSYCYNLAIVFIGRGFTEQQHFEKWVFMQTADMPKATGILFQFRCFSRAQYLGQTHLRHSNREILDLLLCRPAPQLVCVHG